MFVYIFCVPSAIEIVGYHVVRFDVNYTVLQKVGTPATISKI